MKRKEIALIKETRQSKFINKIMNTIGPNLTFTPSDKVAIKIILDGSKEIYANTHYETVESLIFYLKDHFGVKDISVIEGSDGALYSNKTTWDIFYKFRYKEVELNGAKLVNLDDLPHQNKIGIDTLMGEREISYANFDADYTIFVIPPKTHNIFPVLLSIPAVTGFVKPKDRNLVYSNYNYDQKKLNQLNNFKFQRLQELSAKNVVKLYKQLPASLVIVDGLFGMEGKGPVKGSPVFHGFSIASEDAVTADALTAYVMGFEQQSVPYIEMAAKEELGNANWQNIIGVEPHLVKFPYRPHPIFHKFRNSKNRKDQTQKSKKNIFRKKEFKKKPNSNEQKTNQ